MSEAQNEDDQLRSVALRNASSIFVTRQREDELRARLAAIVESSDDAILSKTLQGVILTWNNGAERMFGYRADEMIGKSVTILIPLDCAGEEDGILAQLRRGERVDHYETVRLRKDGTSIDVSLTISPIKDAAGNVIGASKIARDITSRKRIEQALRESEARLRAVVETTPECVKIVEPDGILRFMNDAGVSMIEAESFASVQGSAVPGMITPEHRARWLAYHARVCGGERLSWEYEIVGLKGTRRWMETHAVPLPLSTGGNAQLAVTRDITAEKEAQAERERLLIAERIARAQAEHAGIAKDEFLATLSHELRTPLNAILGWTQILRTQGGVSAEDLTEGLEVIERNTRVQTQLIEDLLDLSRITSGKIRLDVQQVDLQDVVKAAVASVRHSADVKDIRLQIVLDPLAGPVRGDPGRLQQCFWNLLSNAIKFTPKGGKVQVTLQRINSHLEACVIDDGEGISSEFLPHVFERFRQADASSSRRHGGLGLGLSIVKHLVELHGGRVRVTSAGPRKGSTFCIELPLMPIHSSVDESSREHPRRTGGVGPVTFDHPSLEGLTVLAVDDEPDGLRLVQRVLEECGARVITAGSAEKGLELVISQRPDMILSDIGMPNEDGYAFIQKVRALSPEQGGHTPAAALTAFARAEDRTRALRAGYQTHVAKPVESTELTAVVASLTSRAGR